MKTGIMGALCLLLAAGGLRASGAAGTIDGVREVREALAGLGYGEGEIPEVPFQIEPSSYYFALKDPADFQVARPGSFGDMSQFKVSELRYALDVPADEAWAQYMAISPLVIWSNTKAWLTAIYVPSKGRVLYREDLEAEPWGGFEEGMKIFVDAATLPIPFVRNPAFMVALQILRVDPAARTVVFRYLEGTPSYGEQVIELAPTPGQPGSTTIRHDTWFRSYGRVIEALYPIFHRRLIHDMHARYRWEIEAGR